MLAQPNAATQVSTNKRVQIAQELWEDDDKDGAKAGLLQRFSNVRKKIKTNLTALVKECHKDAELDYLINTTQALVASNDEIWSRVKANLKSHANKQFNQLDEEPKLIFHYVGFNVVKALSKMDGYGQRPGPLAFRSVCMEHTKAFSVTCFPDPLRSVIIPTLDKDGMLNYSEYVKRSFILDKDIMHPFLALLKDHLEEFQVFLGTVESWLMENARNTAFLEKTFNVTLKRSKEIGTQYTFKRMYRPSDETQYNLSFDVGNNKGQKTLTKFLAFLIDAE